MAIRSKSWVVGLLLMAALPALAGNREWKMAVTPHYRLISQLNDRETAKWMRDFDQFILSTSDVLQMDLRVLPPLTVVIFARDTDYTPYKLRLQNGQPAQVAGQFVRRPTWSIIAMVRDWNNRELRRTIHHEATHWLMSVDQSRQPAWLTEGIAEMFSTFERRGDQVNWAKPISAHLAVLHYMGRMPLERFLIAPSAFFEREQHTAQFYAQAWAFTHFLMMSKDPGRRQLLFKFLQSYRTQSGKAAVESVFGPALQDIEREFHLYTNQHWYTYMVQPAKPAPEPPPLQPAPGTFVEATLGFLALGADQKDLARNHAEKAIALDQNAPDGHALLAYLAMENNELDEAATHAETALQLGSQDGDLFLLLGASYAHGKNAERANAKQLRVSMYENAINLNPRRLAAYQELVEALFAIDTPREEDARFLEVVLRAFPGEDWLRVGTAVVDYRLGRREAAMSTLADVLRPESTLDETERDRVNRLRRRWVGEEVQAAFAKSGFQATREVLDRYRNLRDDPEIARLFEQLESLTEMNDEIEQFEAALRAHRTAEARTLADQLLAHGDLPEAIRRYLEQRLRDGM
ncbi:MAG: DUF1570 domain-containing protein [Steroidobacteraceae bacterium]|nr:DUF1570 domain-containing protein [Steroidobacteraceae bacterium]